MHVEPLEKLPHSVREFLSHYAMIVLSILTALALEQLLVGIEHRHQGERAREEIEAEIADNRAQVAGALKDTRENLRQWEAMLAQTAADLKSGRSSDATRLATLAQAAKAVRDSTPPLKTTAWDAAISAHSVDYLDHADLTRYSGLYASQRFFSQTLFATVLDSGFRTMDGVSLPGLLGKADAEPTIATLNTRTIALRTMESLLAQMDAALRAPGDAGH